MDGGIARRARVFISSGQSEGQDTDRKQGPGRT
jgi:hypothetical protein